MHPLILTLALFACGAEPGADFADPSRAWAEPAPEGAFHTEIHQPSSLGALDTHLVDVRGGAIGVACATCHGPGADGEVLASLPGEPEELHAGVRLEHGALSCNSCHDPGDRSLLRLADGATLEMDQAMTLCAQCHGVQTRDYRRGSHGGMSGYWDLSRGPRLRNHCLDCHGAHDPAYGQVQPAPGPRDRFIGGTH